MRLRIVISGWLSPGRVTGGTCRLERLETHDGLAAVGSCDEVTALAGDFCVLACERETRHRHVIKLYRLPRRGRVAARAVRHAIRGGELTVMLVCMAGDTADVCITKPDCHNTGDLSAGMTALTKSRAMRPGKSEPRACMVELRHVPALHIVATLTAVAGDALVELTCVRIGMASEAFKGFPSELMFPCTVRIGFRMTGGAGYGRMRPSQGKTCAFVLRGFESGGRKAVEVVAALAGALVFALREVALVIILVAKDAMREIRILETREISADVALHALQAPVPTLQREMRFRMVEVSARDGHVFPSCWRVALLAFLAECAFVMVFVAAETRRKCDALELLVLRVAVSLLSVILLRMAGNASDAGVLADEREFRLVMAEAVLLPLLRRMAAITLAELSAVLVFMTVGAFRREPEICLFYTCGSFFPDVRRMNIVRIVTFPAFEAVVPGFK